MGLLHVQFIQIVSIARGGADAATEPIKLKSINFILDILAEGSCEIGTGDTGHMHVRTTRYVRLDGCFVVTVWD